VPATLVGNGGLGHAIDARYRIDGYKGYKGLQVVQIFFGTPSESDPPGLFEFKVGGITYRGFVDGGNKSRNALQGHDKERVPEKPYYWAEEVLAKPQNYDFDPIAGVGTIKVYDIPMGLHIYDAGYFESAIMALPKTGPDELVITIRWGWCVRGMMYRADPNTASTEYKPVVSEAASDTFRNILKDNYPNYEFV